MAFVVFVDTIYCELVYQMFGQTCQNTLYFRNEGLLNVGRLEDAASELSAWWISEMKPLVSNSLTLVEVTVRDMNEQFGLYAAESFAAVGDLVSPGLPLNVTAAIKFNTGLVGRRRRGRNFIVGLVESQVSGNELIAGPADDFIGAYEQLNTQMAILDFYHIVASRAECVPEESCVGVGTLVQSYTMDTFIDSQRRRLSGRGS